jgi:hypothetical protein
MLSGLRKRTDKEMMVTSRKNTREREMEKEREKGREMSVSSKRKADVFAAEEMEYWVGGKVDFRGRRAEKERVGSAKSTLRDSQTMATAWRKGMVKMLRVGTPNMTSGDNRSQKETLPLMTSLETMEWKDSKNSEKGKEKGKKRSKERSKERGKEKKKKEEKEKGTNLGWKQRMNDEWGSRSPSAIHNVYIRNAKKRKEFVTPNHKRNM